MGNLGAYQAMTTAAKKVGGPKKLVALTLATGYVLFRPVEAGVRRAWRSLNEQPAPCATKGQTFLVTDGGEYGGLRVRAGDEYEVLECDGDAILITVRGQQGNPHFVPAEFLRSVSSFPVESTAGLP